MVTATVTTAVLGLIGVLVTVIANQHRARRDRLLKDFAEALTAAERYAELPYRVRRRQGSNPETREHISETIHEVQQDLLFYQNWVRIQDPCVAGPYEAFIGAARSEAGHAMKKAWRTDPITNDADMCLGDGYDFPKMKQRRAEYVESVRWQLQWGPVR